MGSIVVTATQTATAAETNTERRVVWDEKVVDNEWLGRKSSKICCIYHKPKKRFDESSDESDSSEDGDGPNAYERQPDYTGRNKKKNKKGKSGGEPSHDHSHDHEGGHSHNH
ncbi:phosphatase inhibitor-domain-containing protein [Obelidium mucronatum]|nr:phosphatase inhibitor-domain-containing protein [Obelidium mucronatum]